jgi:hypothetical protein
MRPKKRRGPRGRGNRAGNSGIGIVGNRINTAPDKAPQEAMERISPVPPLPCLLIQNTRHAPRAGRLRAIAVRALCVPRRFCRRGD